MEKEEVEDLLALAKKYDRLLLSALKTAFLPAFCQLLIQLEDGVIGEIKEVRATYTSLYKEKYYPDVFLKQGATNTLLSYPALNVCRSDGLGVFTVLVRGESVCHYQHPSKDKGNHQGQFSRHECVQKCF